MRSTAAIQSEMLALSPPGYSRSPDSVWAKQLLAAAAEGSLIEQMGDALHGEIDPRQAKYLLAEWEALFGPDPYGVDTGSMNTTQLQAYLYQRLVNRGGQSRAFFIGLAAALGVSISITEFVVTRYDEFVYDEFVYCEDPAQFQWIVTLPKTQIVTEVYDQFVYDEPWQSFTPSPIVPIFTALKPAHTQLVFSYTG